MSPGPPLFRPCHILVKETPPSSLLVSSFPLVGRVYLSGRLSSRKSGSIKKGRGGGNIEEKCLPSAPLRRTGGGRWRWPPSLLPSIPRAVDAVSDRLRLDIVSRKLQQYNGPLSGDGK